MYKKDVYELQDILAVCKEVAIRAGVVIMQEYNSEKAMLVDYKEDKTPLTLADRESNKIIVETLREKYPEYAILSEEEKDDITRLKKDYCFIIDPLDGTKEFIKRNGQFTVNIGLAYKHEIVMGVIYVPCTGELYFASKNQGAYLQIKGNDILKLKVSNCVDMDKLRVVASGSHNCKEMERLIEKYKLKNIVKMGSSLKGCLIAKGDAEIYYRYNPTMEWDTAAMQCIVEEAGGIFCQMDGSQMRYNRENSLNDKGFFVVNNKKCILE